MGLMLESMQAASYKADIDSMKVQQSLPGKFHQRC